MQILVYSVWPVPFWEVPKGQVEQLRRRFPDVTFTHALNEREATAAIQTADAALTPRISPSMVENAHRLKWVHSTAAAVGSLPLKELSARQVIVTNSRGVQAIPIAEYVLGGILLLARRFDLMLAAQRERRWIQDNLSSEAWPWTLFGRTMTICGLGTIGHEVARRAHAFGVRVVAVRRRPDLPKPPFVDCVFGPKQLDDALRGSDMLVISVPFLPETNRLIGAHQLGLLHPGAIVVNVGRGRVIEEDALITALRRRHLGGAVLDVFDPEPLDPHSPLWDIPNVIITPHSSGLRPDHWHDVIDLFSSNLCRFQNGESLLNIVDCQAGY